jgi:hypothetical protein
MTEEVGAPNEAPAHACRTCGAPIPTKHGAPRAWCELHRPPVALYQAAWQKEHGAALRVRLGHRPLAAAVCACGSPFRTYLGMTKCIRCRQLGRPR